jgi:hypothetical protein
MALLRGINQKQKQTKTLVSEQMRIVYGGRFINKNGNNI